MRQARSVPRAAGIGGSNETHDISQDQRCAIRHQDPTSEKRMSSNDGSFDTRLPIVMQTNVVLWMALFDSYKF